jgi:pantoate--beta-alanine ligase
MSQDVSGDPFMHLIHTISEMQTFAREVRARGRSLALVPTMGALHEGHFSLVRHAKRQCDAVIVSTYVNSKQFTSAEDLDRYPRDLEHDLELLQPFKIDAVFAPRDAEIYPEGFATFVDPGEIPAPLEGAFRPGHFRGVATVVLKLVNIVRPDVAYFGQKDFEQALVIRRLVEDLNLDVRPVICPIVRDPDGLAASSRNALLDAEDRAHALVLHRALRRAEERVHSGEADSTRVRAAIETLLGQEPKVQPEYVAIVEPARLQPVRRVVPGSVALVAARVGRVRLIDNLIFGPPGSSPELLLQMALTAQPWVDTQALIPGFETEAIERRIASCRECAAISTILLPPHDYLSQYVKVTYPDRSLPTVAVVARDSPRNSDFFLYRRPEQATRFARGLYELLGVKDFGEFKSRFILTDAIRCHATGPHVPDKALAYCARHLLGELSLFPTLRTLVILGDDAYRQFQRYVLGRGEEEFKPFEELLGEQGWAREEVRIPALDERTVKIFYCYHPTYGYRRSPSVGVHLAE